MGILVFGPDVQGILIEESNICDSDEQSHGRKESVRSILMGVDIVRKVERCTWICIIFFTINSFFF